MMRKRPYVLAGTLALAALGGLFPRPLAAQIAPTGPEIRVDTLGGVRYPDCPGIGAAPGGSFEIAWGDTLSPDVEGRHYGANGTPTGPFASHLARLNDSPAVLAVTPDANGFRILIEAADNTGDRSPRFYQRGVDRDGDPAGPPRPIGAPGTDWISAGPGGTLFAGVYNPARHRLSVQKIAADGKPGGKSYVLNSRPIDARAIPRIVPLADGGWVAVFLGHSLAASDSPARQVIRARRFDAAGRPAGPDFDVNPPLGTPGSSPALDFRYLVVAADPAGGFAVSWEVGQQIRLSFFNAAGVRTGKSYAIAGAPPLVPSSAAYDAQGRLLLLYGTEDGSASLHGRFFTSDALLDPLLLHSAASGDFTPICGNAAWTGDSWLITWAARNRINGASAIFMRRFR